MSTHIVEDNEVRWVFGWDQTYRSFFLTKHDKTLSEEENVIFALGKRPREIASAEGLFVLSAMVGLDIPIDLRDQLYKDKDIEENTYFVLYYPQGFVYGFRTDSLGHAELLKETLVNAKPGKELRIRKITNF